MGRFFRKDIQPRCEYCTHGRQGPDKTVILCKHSGILSPDDQCRKFTYDPLRRTPRVMPDLPDFSDEDFSV